MEKRKKGRWSTKEGGKRKRRAPVELFLKKKIPPSRSSNPIKGRKSDLLRKESRLSQREKGTLIHPICQSEKKRTSA